MKAVAVITARGGSKRIPRKNIKLFLDKPIIAYSIEAALASGVFETVMVSTDDKEIAEIAKEYGAEVPFFRSADNAGDFATTADVILEVLEQYKQNGEEFDEVCCIYPTAPFVSAGKLKKAQEMLEENKADAVQPVVRFGFPPQRSVIIEDGFAKFKWPEYMLSRSQDLEPFYHDAGQFYFLNVGSFLEQKRLVMQKTIAFEMPEMEVQDIDTEEDWAIAEVKYRVQKQKEEGSLS